MTQPTIEYLTIKEACKRVKLCREMLDRARRETDPQKRLVYAKIGRKILIRSVDLDDWVRRNLEGTTTPQVGSKEQI
ncbi:MAG TPA: helix-turn-helix domain-containing protein [Candidatus Angelobacter sp.]|nr:helix-turn-helix domain-containing protein [Candidatus Angelobacter sp.]